MKTTSMWLIYADHNMLIARPMPFFEFELEAAD